jgi:hypothetical protein
LRGGVAPLQLGEGGAVGGEGVDARPIEPAQLVEHRGERAHDLVHRGGVGDVRRRQVLLQAVALGELLDTVARLQHHAAENAHHATHRHHPARVDQRRARRRAGRAALALALRLGRHERAAQVAQLGDGPPAQPLLRDARGVLRVGLRTLLQEGDALELLLAPRGALSLQQLEHVQVLRGRPLVFRAPLSLPAV